TVAVKGRRRGAVVVAERAASLVVGASVRVRVARELPPRLVGPLPAGSPAGSVVVREDGRRVLSLPLVTATAVPAPAPRLARRDDEPLLWMVAGGAVGAILVGCSLPLMRRRLARATLEV